MNISICIIAKNESKNISRCLKSIANTGAEIVVVDTGSKDNTKELAQNYTDKVYDYIWNDDFGAAKEFAISKATNDNILILDSDEFLVGNSNSILKKVEVQINQNPMKVGRIKRINILDENYYFSGDDIIADKRSFEWINRIFNRRNFMISGKIHEQVISINNEEYDTYLTDICIIHVGYALSFEDKQIKTKRNFKLLYKRLDELKNINNANLCDEEIPYVLYQIGKSYYMEKEYNKACEYFSKALEYNLNPRLEYVINMVETYGYSLLNSGQVQKALLFENIYKEFGNTADFEFLMALIYMNNEKFENSILHFKKALKYKNCSVEGVNSYMALYNIGVIYECLGSIAKALEYYNQCGNYEPARKRIQELKKI